MSSQHSMTTVSPLQYFRKAPLAQIVLTAVGAALVTAALAANQAWFDRHLLPSFFTPREKIVQIETRARIGVAICGAVTILFRKRMGRFAAKEPLQLLTIGAAISLAFGAAELVLRLRHFRSAEEVRRSVEPLRHLDAQI